MDNINVWQSRLYPTEWGFRFFITGALVWLVGRQWHEPVAMATFYLLTIAVTVAFVIQVWVMISFIRSRRNDAVHQ
jgi:membrane protein DedA with SNARE-associated domain